MRTAPALLVALALTACGSLAPTAEERAACADAILASEGVDVGGVSPNWDVRTNSSGRSVTLSYPGSRARPAVTCTLRDGAVRSITLADPRGVPPGPGPDELDI